MSIRKLSILYLIFTSFVSTLRYVILSPGLMYFALTRRQARFKDTKPEVFKIFSEPRSPLDPKLKQKYPSLSDFDATCQFLMENGAGDFVEMYRQVWGRHQ